MPLPSPLSKQLSVFGASCTIAWSMVRQPNQGEKTA
jgi:hypothetical protein